MLAVAVGLVTQEHKALVALVVAPQEYILQLQIMGLLIRAVAAVVDGAPPAAQAAPAS